MTRPPHHRPNGGFRNPWPEAAGDDALRKRFSRVAWEWATKPMPPDPEPDALPIVASELATPVAVAGEMRITWIGHASFYLQLPGLNLLTDPVWSPRVSPVTFAGTRRFVPAVPSIDSLPGVDAVLLSHDHYDHLDRPTVIALRERYGEGLTWLTPLGYRSWFRRLGIRGVLERDWWQDAELPGGAYTATCAPARHWTRRTPWATNRRLWCSWAIAATEGAGARLYFGGDSGYGPFFEEIGRRLGPFDASLLPIGAYDPRWFMSAAHMNPEEAVRAYGQLGGRGVFVPAHWGTFRLTFEPPLEPPVRARAAWAEAGLSPEDLRVLRHGETLTVACG